MADIWLFAFNFAGRIWYLASRSCAPVQANGSELPHYGSLTVGKISETLQYPTGSSGSTTAELTFDLGDVDGWTLINTYGYDPNGATGVLSKWPEGQPYSSRTIQIRGYLVTVNLPRPNEPWGGTLQVAVLNDADAWPPATDLITTTIWPATPLSSSTAYPFPIGQFGRYQNDNGSVVNLSTYILPIVTNALGVERSMIAGAPIGSTTIRVVQTAGTGAGASGTVDVLQQADTLGNICSLADLSSFSPVDDDAIFYGENFTGITGPNATSGIVGLGDALLFLLMQRYGPTGPDNIDYSSWNAARPLLNGRKPALLPTSEDPWNLINGTAAKLAPRLWLVGGPFGLQPIILQDPLPSQNYIAIEVGRNANHIDESQPILADIQVINGCSATFANSDYFGADQGNQSLLYSSTAQGQASRSQVGSKTVALGSLATYDRATVEAVELDTVMLSSRRPTTLSLAVDVDLARTLSRGMCILLTDADYALNGQPAWIIGQEIDDPGDDPILTFLWL